MPEGHSTMNKALPATQAARAWTWIRPKIFSAPILLGTPPHALSLMQCLLSCAKNRGIVVKIIEVPSARQNLDIRAMYGRKKLCLMKWTPRPRPRLRLSRHRRASNSHQRIISCLLRCWGHYWWFSGEPIKVWTSSFGCFRTSGVENLCRQLH